MNVVAILRNTFLAIGIAALGGTAAIALHTRHFVRTALKADGTVVDVLPNRTGSNGTVTYSPVVEFKAADGRLVEVRSSAGSSPPAFREGDRVTVLYRADAPVDARIATFGSLWGSTVILGGLGAVFLLIGAGMAVVPWRAARRTRDLVARGTRLQAEVRGVEVNERLSANGRHPWRVVAQWKNPVTAELHQFRSDNLWDDPTAHLPSFVIVFIDGQNPRKYHLDTAFLPTAR